MTELHFFRWINVQVARTLVLVGAALATALADAAEPDFPTEHAQAVAANPKGASFAIGLIDPQAQFRVGELIPLDLVYTFAQPDAYLINDGLASGSGTARLLEVFRVSPQTGTRRRASDTPNFRSWAGGTPQRAKTNRDYRYRVYLNEWRRFDKPGKYRFYSTSARVWKPNVYPSGDNELRLTSNLLELEIVPSTAEWQAEQVRAAVEALDRQIDKTKEQPALRREALRRLRYLDTEAATRELARRQPGLNEGEEFDIGMGLHESRFKAAAVEELQQHLDAPNFVVTAQFLVNLAALAADAQVPIDYDAFRNNEDSREALDRLTKEHHSMEQTLRVKYFEAAWTAAETKEPLVRARSLLELIEFMNEGLLGDKSELSAKRLARIRAAVLPVFDQLPARDRWLLLESHWKLLGGVEVLPALRKFIAVAPERKQGERSPTSLDLVFRRVLQLAPDEGRALILAELRRARPRATSDSLTLLPDQPIPELDDSLATRLEQSIDDLDDAELAATLVARYGSAAIYDRVRKVYGDNGGSWACALQASLLAYLMRHDPTEGAQLMNQAIGATQQTGCYRSVLTDVARVHMTVELERIAVEHLDDENLEVATDALSLLQRHGSAAAEPSLWRRFEKWHAAWSGRVGELTVVDSGSQTYPQVRFEGSLVDALAYGRSWITDPPKLQRLRKLCLTKPHRQQVDHLLAAWGEPIPIRFSSGRVSEFSSAPASLYRGAPAYDNWYVAQYSAESLAELKSLLARFPNGTSFSFPAGMLTDESAEERLFGELEQHLAAHGLKLVTAPRPE